MNKNNVIKNEETDVNLFKFSNDYTKLIKLEELSNNDYSNLHKWITNGRKEGFFKQENGLSINQIRKYHKNIIKKGWDYKCFIIKLKSKLIGYIDYKIKNKVGCIEGIFIIPKFRNMKIGSFAFRWVLADLRLKGVKKVLTDVFENNLVSLKVLEALGFILNLNKYYIEHEKKIFRLELNIKKYERFKEKYKSYSKLKGTNHYQYHLAIAETLLSKWKKDDNIQAVLALGSISREFGDVWSDIDLVILGNKSIYRNYWVGERWISGYSIDLFLIDQNENNFSNWDDSRRQAISEGIILYSRNKSIVSNIKKVVKLKKDEKKDKISELLLNIGWQGFQPQNWYSKEVFGYYWSLSPKMWLSRGSINSAQLSLDYSFQLLVKLIYLVNNEIPPDNKWIFYIVDSLKWLPNNFNQRLLKYNNADNDYNGFIKKHKIFSELLNSVIIKLKKQNLIHKNIFASYLRTIKEY